MAKRTSLAEQLNEAVEAMMADPNAPSTATDPRLTELLQIAADLRHLPTEEFKARLKADLQRTGAVTRTVNPVPQGYHTATPCLVIREAGNALEFYKKAFGATELIRHADPSGKIVHAEFQIGDSRIAIADEAPEWGNHSPQSLGGSPVIISLYVEDVDSLADQAIGAGAKLIFPIADQFYGDRSGRLADPFGHIWIVSTHKEDVSPEEMQRRAQAWTTQQEHTGPPATPTVETAYSVEPYVPVRGAARLIDFLKQAFGAEETSRHTRPDGSVARADVQIGDSVFGIGDSTDLPPAPTALHVYVEDVDAVYERALQAGATSIEKPADQDYGERGGGVTDPFGNNWYIATYTGSQPGRPPYLPAGLHSVMPYLHPHGAPMLIDFLKQAFDAEESFRAQAPDGTVVHAKIRIGESIVEMGEAHGSYQPMPTIFHLYVDDTDAVYLRSLHAGAVSLSQPTNQPWGYRNAGVQDPCGNQWWINAPTTAPSSVDRGHDAAKEQAGAPDQTGPHDCLSVTPFLHVREVRNAVKFMKAAFGAELIAFDRGGEPPHDHAEVRIGDSVVMVGEALPGYEPTASAFYLLVDDADAAYRRALNAGLTGMEPPQDKPWGDRMAHVKDGLGNSWYIAAHRKGGGE
jgi:PhnB protein